MTIERDTPPPPTDPAEEATAMGGGSAGSDNAASGPEPAPARAGHAPGAGILATLAMAWLVAVLSSTVASIRSPDVGSLAITFVALAMPMVISASLVAGAAVGLSVLNVVPKVADRTAARFGLATAAGLATGLAAAAVVLLTTGADTPLLVLGGTLTAGATLGGALAGVRLRTLVAAVVAATLAVFVIGFVLRLFRSALMNLYGASGTASSQLTASVGYAITAAAVSGLIAGLVAFRYLRRTGHSGGPARWPAYLLAGAGPGLVALLAELIARVGGSPVLTLASSVSAADRAVLGMEAGYRINAALAVLFIGALSALIAFGRTLPARVAGSASADSGGAPDAAGGATGTDDGQPANDAPGADAGEPAGDAR